MSLPSCTCRRGRCATTCRRRSARPAPATAPRPSSSPRTAAGSPRPAPTGQNGRPGGGAHRRPAALVEAVVLLLAVLVFLRLHAAAGTDVASATANAQALQSVERVLHLDIERRANAWLAGHPALIQP